MKNVRMSADYRKRAQKTFSAEDILAKHISYLWVSRKNVCMDPSPTWLPSVHSPSCNHMLM